MKLYQYRGPFKEKDTITIHSRLGYEYVHIGIQIPNKQPLARQPWVWPEDDTSGHDLYMNELDSYKQEDSASGFNLYMNEIDDYSPEGDASSLNLYMNEMDSYEPEDSTFPHKNVMERNRLNKIEDYRKEGWESIQSVPVDLDINGTEYRLSSSDVLEFDNISVSSWDITILRDLPWGTIIDIVYEESTI